MTAVPVVGVRDAIVNGVDVDAVAAALRRCPGVEDLLDGPPAAASTYLPRRRIDGIVVDPVTVVVQIRARWGYDFPAIAAQIQAATAALLPNHRVAVVVAELGDPPEAPTGQPRVAAYPAPAVAEEVPWTSSSPVSGRHAERSSAPTIPIAAAIPAPSSPA